jgi:hypothetical protein
MGQDGIVASFLRRLDNCRRCRSQRLGGVATGVPLARDAASGERTSTRTPADRPSCSKCSRALRSCSSSRTCGTVRYVPARPRKGDSESSGPASRTSFRQAGDFAELEDMDGRQEASCTGRNPSDCGAIGLPMCNGAPQIEAGSFHFRASNLSQKLLYHNMEGENYSLLGKNMASQADLSARHGRNRECCSRSDKKHQTCPGHQRLAILGRPRRHCASMNVSEVRDKIRRTRQTFA